MSKGDLPTGKHRERNKLGHGKNLSKQKALTYWRIQRDKLGNERIRLSKGHTLPERVQRERQVITWKESD